MTPAASTTSDERRERAKALCASLLAWYDRHRRSLPWRAEPGAAVDPYRVLVSELMLQQTTVATVSGRFGPFIERFPDLESLALADEADVLHAWQGLGYYRRARALHAAARAVMTDHDGRLPDRVDRLLALPGIGEYTAKAVAAIAFGQPVLPVDGNGVRVLTRMFAIETPLPRAANEARAIAVPPSSPASAPPTSPRRSWISARRSAGRASRSAIDAPGRTPAPVASPASPKACRDVRPRRNDLCGKVSRFC